MEQNKNRSIEDVIADTLIMRMGISSLPRETALVRIVSLLYTNENLEDHFLEEDSPEASTAKFETYSYFKEYVNSLTEDHALRLFSQASIWLRMDTDLRNTARDIVSDWALKRNINFNFPALRTN